MIVQNKRLTGILIAVAVILLIPFIAMQFTAEVNWTVADFIVAAVLLLGTGFICELVFRKLKNNKYRMVILVSIVIVFLLIWAELAVGIFGTPFAGS